MMFSKARLFIFSFCLIAPLACAGVVLAQMDKISFFYPATNKVDTSKWFISDGWTNGDHQSCEWRANAITGKDGKLVMTLSGNGGKQRKYGCAEMRTYAKMSYGTYEARLRTAGQSGTNTAFFSFVGPVTDSPEHDEIDFEFLGKDPRSVSVTHFTNGKSTTGAVVPLGFDSSREFHNYKFEWTKDKIRWYVDDKPIFETPAGTPIPRNDTRIYLSLWSGSKVEDSWMGSFQYKAPVSAEVEWVKFTPAI